MPEMIVSSWADEIDEDETTTLPPPSEKVIGDTKILTEYTINDDGKKTKIVRTFKVVKKMVPKAIAHRKQWDKFGMSRNDRPGPDPSTTVVTDEIFMTVKTYFDADCNYRWIMLESIGVFGLHLVEILKQNWLLDPVYVYGCMHSHWLVIVRK